MSPSPDFLEKNRAFFEEQRRFYFHGDETEYEPLSQYKKGGLHPVLLGDVLPKAGTCASEPAVGPRYRVMVKLGYGAFATVWLAWDRDQHHAVAIKICSASDKPEWGPEALILAHLQTADGGRRHPAIPELFDRFIIEGPNGFHECLVTEVVAPLSDDCFLQLCRSHDHLAQIAAGFAHLHQQGIAHGDPHTGNLGLSLPEIHTRLKKEHDIVHKFASTPVAIPVVARDPGLPSDSTPTYVVGKTEDFPNILSRSSPAPIRTVKILDFGRAFWVEKQTKLALHGGVPEPFRPPEVWVLEQGLNKPGTEWSLSADVWAVANMLFLLRFGTQLVSTSLDGEDVILSKLFELGGSPPDDWLKIWNARPDSQTEVTRPHSNHGRTPWTMWLSRPTILEGSDADNETFLNLMRSMIVTLPEKRCSMADVVAHPYFNRDATRGDTMTSRALDCVALASSTTARADATWHPISQEVKLDEGCLLDDNLGVESPTVSLPSSPWSSPVASPSESGDSCAPMSPITLQKSSNAS